MAATERIEFSDITSSPYNCLAERIDCGAEKDGLLHEAH